MVGFFPNIPNIFSFFRTTSLSKIQDLENKPMVFTAKGASGTEIYSGFFNEEYLSKLFAERGIKIFDEMRRSDGQVKMLLSSVKNPIRSANWDIEAAGEEEQDYEIREFVKYALFKGMGDTEGAKRKTFNEFISEVLTAIEFGFSAFEIVHKLVKNHPIYGDFIGISDLGFRHQRSIIEWILEPNGSIRAVRQLFNGDLGLDTLISGQHMLIFSIEKEGDNYEGISMLRPCYGAWFRKNIYRKLQAIGIERCAKGIPIGIIPAEMLGATDYESSVINFQNLLDQLAAHEKNGIVLGAGFDIKELKISHDSEKVQAVIDSENIEMSKAFLANFMELGLQGNSGSFALGSDLSDIFLNGIQHIADMICEKINLNLIEPLVKAKYGEQENYPTLRATGINDKAGKELAEIVKQLVEVNALQVSTRLQRHLHKLYKLPDLDEELAVKADDLFLNPPDETAPPPAPFELSEGFDVKKKTCRNGEFHMNGEVSLQMSETDRGKFPVSAKIEDYAAELNLFMRKSLENRSNLMLEEMGTIIKSGGAGVRESVLSVTMPKSKSYTTALMSWSGKVVDEVFSMTIFEVGLKKKDVKFAESLKNAPKKLREKLTTMILLTAAYQDSDLEKAVYFSFNENFETLSEAALIAELASQVDKYFDKKIIETVAVNMASSVVNSTRKETFLSPDVAEEIESFVFMNPAPVSPICKSLNGKVFSKEEFESSSLTPPLHHNCYDKETEVYTRGGWKLFSEVDIGKDEFLSLNPENFDLEYSKANDFIKYRFKGELFHFKNKQGSLSQCITPDHPMLYIKRVDRGLNGRKKELIKSNISDFISFGSEASIYCSSKWTGKTEEFIEIHEKSYPATTILRLMGYYLTEGHCGRYGIMITQHKKESKDLIYSQLNQHFDCLKWGNVIRIKDKELREYLLQFGKSAEKFIPEWIKNLSADQIEVFLEAFCLGDGSIYKRKCFSGVSEYRVFCTSSKKMAGDLTELLIKTGRSASMRMTVAAGTPVQHWNGIFKSKNDQYLVSDLSSESRRVGLIEKIDYDDFVFDVSLQKNHTLLIKRNGCISWGSNCKSYIRAQTAGAKGNSPITGLTIDGSAEEVDKILRSKTL